MHRLKMFGSVFLAQPLLTLLLVPAMSAFTPPMVEQETDRPAGRWEGSLTLPSSGKLDFSLELWRDDKQWQGVISIPAQNLDRYPLSTVEVKDEAFSFAMQGIPGDPVFSGTISGDGLRAEGTLKQGMAEMPFQMDWKGEVTPSAKTEALDAKAAEAFLGDWEGRLEIPSGKLRMRFHLQAGPEGKLKASLDSPDQGRSGLPVSKVEVEGRTLRLYLDYIRGVFEGELSEDGAQIEGTWKQNGAEFPLVLEPYSG